MSYQLARDALMSPVRLQLVSKMTRFSQLTLRNFLIAAHARHIGAALVSNNEREFRRVPGLSVQNWLTT